MIACWISLKRPFFKRIFKNRGFKVTFMTPLEVCFWVKKEIWPSQFCELSFFEAFLSAWPWKWQTACSYWGGLHPHICRIFIFPLFSTNEWGTPKSGSHFAPSANAFSSRVRKSPIQPQLALASVLNGILP
jgi:hypothetical protein